MQQINHSTLWGTWSCYVWKFLKDTKHHIRKYWGVPFNVRNISLNQMRRNNRDILLPSLRGFRVFWFTFLEATIICPLLCSAIAWMYEIYKSCNQTAFYGALMPTSVKAEEIYIYILKTKMITEWNWKPREALEHVQSTYIANQGIHAKACHIWLGQYAEISGYMVQQMPTRMYGHRQGMRQLTLVTNNHLSSTKL